MIYYAKQSIDQNDIDNVLRVLQSSHLTQGQENIDFASSICEYIKAKYCLTFSSATSALYASCRSLELGPGDYYWTTPNTFVATANVAIMCGANIDFVDIDPKSFNLCPDALEKKLVDAKKKGKLPKVLCVVHFAGTPAEMERIYTLSEKYGFSVIEDASHAIGAKIKNNFVGSDPRTAITVFSFHPVKIITTGEGGAAVVHCKKLFQKLRLYQSHGVTRIKEEFEVLCLDPWYYEQKEISLNFRMTEIQAALGISQLSKIEKFIERRNEIHKLYQQSFADLPLQQQAIMDSDRSALHLEIVQTKNRKALYDFLAKQGITCNVHYIPVHTQPFYRNKFKFKWGDFPNSEYYYNTCLSMPMFPDLSDVQLEHIIFSVRRFFND